LAPSQKLHVGRLLSHLVLRLRQTVHAVMLRWRAYELSARMRFLDDAIG
jgi:hypothetical protein